MPNDGLIRFLGILNQEHLLLTSPQAMSEVLVTNCYDYEKTPESRFGFGRLVGDGLVLSEGDAHKYQRKLLNPAFSFRHIKDLYPLFWEKAREGVEAIIQQIQKDAGAPYGGASGGNNPAAGKEGFIEVGGWASRITLDIIGVAALGRDFGAIKDPHNLLFQTYKNMFGSSPWTEVLFILRHVLPGWFVSSLPIQREGEIRAAVRLLRSTCHDLIQEKQKKLAVGELKDIDILSVAVESGGFTDENLINQLMTFLAAGHEPTVIALTWGIYALCCNPEVQNRLRQEIREHLPVLSDPAARAAVTSIDIDHMPYLNAVCSEILRLYPSVSMSTRVAVVDTTIMGHRVPKGTRIVFGTRATNKDPSLWGPDAFQFNPDRWMPKHEGDANATSGGASSNFALLSFLHGPRACIGTRFARAELACLLASWVGSMEFSLRYPEEVDPTKFDLKSVSTTRPANGINVKVKVLDG